MCVCSLLVLLKCVHWAVDRYCCVKASWFRHFTHLLKLHR
ncbi:unnamed protein product [Amoebophrya sp. A25]|nr:unnamed protein product [Amoebophrya sp. A25]|eukprot:GSA25T00013073001.1